MDLPLFALHTVLFPGQGLTLHVFEGNARARAVYARRGFRPESLKYVKFLDESKT